MDSNPTEGKALTGILHFVIAFSRSNTVVSLLIVNSDNLSPTLFDAAFKAASIDTLAYSPTSAALPASGWPTLGSLIDSEKRLVVFLSTTADFATVPYLIDGLSINRLCSAH